MKVKGIFYLKSGLIISEEAELDKEEVGDLTNEEIKIKAIETISSIKESVFEPCFRKDVNGYFEYGDTLFRLSDLSAAKFVIEE